MRGGRGFVARPEDGGGLTVRERDEGEGSERATLRRARRGHRYPPLLSLFDKACVALDLVNPFRIRDRPPDRRLHMKINETSA